MSNKKESVEFKNGLSGHRRRAGSSWGMPGRSDAGRREAPHTAGRREEPHTQPPLSAP